MADISKIRLNNSNYDIKDIIARNDVAALGDRVTDLENVDNLMIYGAVRPTANGWQLISDANHSPKGITTCEVTVDGYLKINHPVGATKVGTMLIMPDESFAKMQIEVGASVAQNATTIAFSGNPVIGGRFSGTGTSLSKTSGFYYNVGDPVWSVDHWTIPVNSAVAALYTVIGGFVNRATNNSYNYYFETNLGVGAITVYPINPTTGAHVTDPQGSIRFDLNILVSPIVSAQKFVDDATLFSNYNLWILGIME